MADVLGVGGVFFKCRDRSALGAWYKEHLGLPVGEWGSAEFMDKERLPASSYTVWGPFSDDTEYFAPSDKPFMVNLIVDDVEGVLARAEAGGATRIGEIQDDEFGNFGWFLDPEGTKVELWKPK